MRAALVWNEEAVVVVLLSWRSSVMSAAGKSWTITDVWFDHFYLYQLTELMLLFCRAYTFILTACGSSDKVYMCRLFFWYIILLSCSSGISSCLITVVIWLLPNVCIYWVWFVIDATVVYKCRNTEKQTCKSSQIVCITSLSKRK